MANNMANDSVQLTQVKQVAEYVNTQLQNFESEGTLITPKNYNVENAVMSAYLKFQQDDKLMACSKQSISEAFLQMATLGLSTTQNQCYFIPYGTKATMLVSYFGKQTALRRINGVIDVVAQAIYVEDTVDYEVNNGITTNLQHKTTFNNRDKGVVGAYAIITLDPGVFGRSQHIEIMTIKEIKQAWLQGHGYGGKNKTHTNFEQEMAKKTVINRAIKNFINTINHEEHNAKFVDTYINVTENEYLPNNREVAEDVEIIPQTLDADISNEISNEIEDLIIEKEEVVIQETEQITINDRESLFD